MKHFKIHVDIFKHDFLPTKDKIGILRKTLSATVDCAGTSGTTGTKEGIHLNW